MKILFLMRHSGYIRNFESTLRMLCDRGHTVHLACQNAGPHTLLDPGDVAQQLCDQYPRFSRGTIALRKDDWSLIARELRLSLDYLRYLTPLYRNAPKLLARAQREAPAALVQRTQRGVLSTAAGRRALSAWLRALDRAIPTDPGLDAFLDAHSPDLVVVTPLIEPGAPQAEYVRSARARGIRTALCVASWDNLTNKGLIHGAVDLVTVWNELMKQEAVELHGVPPAHVAVTGAQPFDHWFDWRASTSREEFCHRVGLPADRPFVLYACSSRFIAPDEASFVRTWLQDLRHAPSPTLQHTGVLIRPHPQNADQWSDADLSEYGPVAVWPRAGAAPADPHSRAEYFDSMYHSAAVVGINTTAEIESAIVGRGVYTILAPAFRETQEGTLHFEHLRRINGGLLHVAETVAQHLDQLDAAVHQPGIDDQRCREFVEAFVRPFGADVPATPKLVDALERLAQQRVAAPAGTPVWAPLVRPVLRRAIARLARADHARTEKTARQAGARERRDAARVAARSKAATKREADDDELRRGQEAEAREAELRRLHEEEAVRAHTRYVQVRDWARRVRDQTADPSLTESERAIIAGLAHLWEATPETIASLRRCGEPISGVRVSDYEPGSEEAALQIRRDLNVLWRQVGRDLFVPESPALGGFGYRKKGDLYNQDTLTLFTALVALGDAAVLGEFRETTCRRLVWEIGGGWGGFAYHVKTVFPNLTYLITSAPDLFLVSAVYLMSMFPGARCRFYDPAAPDDLWRDWEQVDFVFAPESAIASIRPPQVDLTVDLMTLQHMSGGRICAHVQRSFDLGSRYFYSLSPTRGIAEESAHVATAIGRFYWSYHVPARRDEGAVAAARVEAPPAFAHLVGWRRIRV